MIRCKRLLKATKVAIVRHLKGETTMTREKKLTTRILSFALVLMLMVGAVWAPPYVYDYVELEEPPVAAGLMHFKLGPVLPD